ncbi:MAG TPA: TerC family protein [Acidimicrobiales bacterium]|nr:TerC family protein [Acidimicrobiales bacterium]
MALPTQVLASSSDGSTGDFVDFHTPLWEWAALLGFITVLLMVDLLVVHRKAHVASTKEAAIESAVWISIGLAFGLIFFAMHGAAAAGEYYAGFLIEKSLSVDNVFVWALIFSYFLVPRQFQHRVLFWGIFGALVLRAIFIFAGVALIQKFSWIIFIFGGFLLFTAVRLIVHKDAEVHPENNPVLKLVQRVVPSSSEYAGQRLFTRIDGRRLATPLFAVLVLIETTDVIFAVDSIPAILAVSHQPFIVFSSNAFAILGLRALYFLLAGLHERFTYLQQGLAIILAFVGIKMIVSHWYHIPTGLSLGFIALVLTLSIVVSLLSERVPESDPPVQEH